MLSILLIIGFFGYVSPGPAETFAPTKFLSTGNDDRSMFHRSISELGLPPAGMYIIKSKVKSVQNWTYTHLLLMEWLFNQSAMGQSVPGGFISDVLTQMTAMALPVQRFINRYSSYDSGANQYSSPAVNIRTTFERGIARALIQLR